MTTRIQYEKIEDNLLVAEVDKYLVIIAVPTQRATIMDTSSEGKSVISFQSKSMTSLKRKIKSALETFGIIFKKETKNTKGENHWKRKKKREVIS